MSQQIRANYAQEFLLPRSLEEWVPREHPARFVRDFVDELALETLGLKTFPGKEGRPHYAPDMLLTVWLYGWMTRVRSSRGLEKACFESMPFIWLTGNNHPDHNTLWRFFRDNKKALRKLFKLIVEVAVKNDLVGFALHALDGSKILAASSMDTALHQKGLQDELKKIDATIDEQMKQIEKTEAAETPGFAMPQKLKDAQTRKATPAATKSKPAKSKAASIRMTLAETMTALEQAGSEQTRKTYARHGASAPMFGVSFATLGTLLKRIKVDHELAKSTSITATHHVKRLMQQAPSKMPGRTHCQRTSRPLRPTSAPASRCGRGVERRALRIRETFVRPCVTTCGT